MLTRLHSHPLRLLTSGTGYACGNASAAAQGVAVAVASAVVRVILFS